MGRINKPVILGIADGLINWFLLFLSGELCVSKLLDGSIEQCMNTTCVCVFASVIVFCVFIKLLDRGIIAFSIIQFVAFIVLALVFFVINIELHFSIVPRRPLANGDGLLFLFCQILYFALSEILCFSCGIAAMLIHKLRSKKHE